MKRNSKGHTLGKLSKPRAISMWCLPDISNLTCPKLNSSFSKIYSTHSLLHPNLWIIHLRQKMFESPFLSNTKSVNISCYTFKLYPDSNHFLLSPPISKPSLSLSRITIILWPPNWSYNPFKRPGHDTPLFTNPMAPHFTQMKAKVLTMSSTT